MFDSAGVCQPRASSGSSSRLSMGASVRFRSIVDHRFLSGSVDQRGERHRDIGRGDQVRGGGGGGRRLDSSIELMMPTEFPSGSSTMAYRAPQNASSGAL